MKITTKPYIILVFDNISLLERGFFKIKNPLVECKLTIIDSSNLSSSDIVTCFKFYNSHLKHMYVDTKSLQKLITSIDHV